MTLELEFDAACCCSCGNKSQDGGACSGSSDRLPAVRRLRLGIGEASGEELSQTLIVVGHTE